MTPDIDTQPWHVKAACLDEDRERFFSDNQTDIKWALNMCAGCPVKNACLKDSLDYGDQHGIRGGTTAKARARMMRGNR
jgi:hypothetical protein